MKLFLICCVIIFQLNQAATFKRQSLKEKQRNLGGVEGDLQMMSFSDQDHKFGSENYVSDLMYGGNRYQNRLLTKQILHQKLDSYYEKIEFWMHSILKKMSHIKRKADKKINQMAIGIERRNMLLKKYIHQKETAAEIVNQKLEKIHQRRQELAKKNHH